MGQPLLNEIETVRASIVYEGLIGSRDYSEAYAIREETITRNIHYVLKKLDSAPILALYGGWHTYKVRGKFSDRDPWAHQLVESGLSLYTVVAAGASGHYWHDYELYSTDAEFCWEIDIPLDKNTPLKAIFDRWPDYEIAFVDLQKNTDLRIPWQASGKSALSFEMSLSEALDGIVLFKRVTPVRTSLGSLWVYQSGMTHHFWCYYE